MYLRPNRRFKDGKEHRYWSIVENKRCAGGKVVQRQVLYLGEINDGQREAWCRVIEAFDEEARTDHQLALFPADRPMPEYAEGHGVQVRLGAMQLHRPRQWGACWLVCQLYEQLELDRFWAARLPDSREGTCWRHIFETLVCYRLIDTRAETGGMAPAPAVVRAKRHGRSARRRFCAGREERPLPLPRQAGRAQAGAVQALAPPLAGSVRRALRRPALRPDQHVFRMRSAGRRSDKRRYGYSRDKRRTACRWSSRSS